MLYEVITIHPEDRKRILGRLNFLYGEPVANAYIPELERILDVYYAHKSQALIEEERGFDPKERFTQEDVILITYGDLLRGEGPTPLADLAKFCDTYP